MYKVKEIYFTIQGEGAQTGRPAVFVRFSGCNLWSGREEDRATAICRFCDTDFRGTDGEQGGKYSAQELSEQVLDLWPEEGTGTPPFVVCTGGEPLLQLDTRLIQAFGHHGIEIAIETNGTIPVPDGIDWICMSPKASTDIVVRRGNEIKIVYPQLGIDPRAFEVWDFDHYFIQPMDGPNIQANTARAISFCQGHPLWKLSLQTHKLLGLP
jgi:7-carboxy-7-deazaguanine synthase